MAWNEPGGKRRDPWRGPGGGPENGGPPDLDAWLKRWLARLGGPFGRGTRPKGTGFNLGWIVLGMAVAWLALDSWVTIDEAQRGVVLRFGRFHRIMGAGLNFKWPSPVEQAIVVDATRVRSVSDQVRILTLDENIITVDFNVQYRVGDPRAFLFAVRDPEQTVQQAAESAVREVIGATTMDKILSGELVSLSDAARRALQKTLDGYSSEMMGQASEQAVSFINVGEFNFQNVRPPPEVKDAFDDAITAREDKQRIENEAQAYSSKVVPEARGAAARIRAESEGDREAAIAIAQGAAERFSLLAAQYLQAPEVTRKRLMIETMQSVLSNAPKVLVEGGGEKVVYLPLDRIGVPSDPRTEIPATGEAGAGMTRLPAVEAARGREATRQGREGRNP